MRRIILALSVVTLTACDAGSGRDPGRGEPDGTATVATGRDAAASGVSARGASASGAAASGAAASGAAASDATGNPGGAPTNGARPDATARQPVTQRTVLFVGTSLTAGYGVGEDVAWPAVIQQKIADEGLPYRVVNAGISGETSAGGLRRIDWSLQRPVDVLVLELGANDGLRALDPDAMRSNLDEIMRRTRARYPDAAIVLVGMEAPPNLGAGYTTRFRQVFTDLAREHRAALVPFLLEGVAGERSLNIADGIHPNARGHRILAETVWQTLGPLLRDRAAQPPSSD